MNLRTGFFQLYSNRQEAERVVVKADNDRVFDHAQIRMMQGNKLGIACDVMLTIIQYEENIIM